MKKIFSLALCGLLVLSFSTINPVMAQKRAVKKEMNRGKVKSLEGSRVAVEENALTGFEMVESLNEEGTKLVKVAYKWFAGTAKADNKSMAIEMALSEARAEVSRSILNMVQTESERGAMANNGQVQQALKSYWNQVSMSVQNGCEPLGNALVEYDKKTGMYNVRAKVGIRGDLYKKMLNTAGQKPTTLTGEDLKAFEETNASIINAAKGE
ncbi:MAG: hypothetical protein NC396_03075 [Bacteroides sp.]|nr:hypothetical protein [Bacteroides sp.]MCM1085186.1 hypothetical protein [Bacteroides sp.]